MKHKRALSLLLAVVMALSMGSAALAAETTTAQVPVTLTVINTMQRISITCPASLPVAVVDGYAVTATNAKIANTASSGSVHVSGVNVQAGAFSIGSYEDFEDTKNTMALSINGCPTTGTGELEITSTAFPDIEAGESLALDYDAKVSTNLKNLSGITAAYLVFTISAT